jgi:hypothetical protein
MSITLSNWVYISDEVTADANYFVTAARPNTDATMAATSLASTHNGGGRNVTVTTNGSESGITLTATGTDVDGAAQTEEIALPGSATLTAGTKIFKTVTAVSVTSQPAANITVGFGTACGAKIGGGGVFGSFRTTSGAVAGTCSFRTGGTAGTVIATDKSSGSAGGNNGQVSAHGTGARLVNGMYVTYTLTHFIQIIAFYAG